MKLQLQGPQLRVRINEDELARLLDGQSLEERTVFGAAFAIDYSLQAIEAESFQLDGSPAHWQLGLPLAALRTHAAQLPTRDGLHFTLGEGAQALQLTFDVDVRDSVRRRYPRDKDRPAES
ncbi:MAG: hypothetical protein ABW154_10875 [Dyella sp.]